MKNRFDVIIIGGGPAGSILGSYLAREGIDCAIFEKEQFPRPHVGESLVVSSTLIFQELNLIEKMEAMGFPKKYGAVWTTEKNKKIHAHDWEDVDDAYHMEIQFKDRVLEGAKQNHTYHVDRGRFDEMLLQHAQHLGCHTFQGTKVAATTMSENGVQVETKNPEGNTATYSAKLLVDASGRDTFIGKKNKWKVKDPVFNQFAIHSWFKDYKRSDIENDNITIHFLPVANSWIWQIPITEEITSIGIVAQKENFLGKKEHAESYFWETLKTRPELRNKLEAARQIRPFSIEGDYSYAMKEIIDDRLLLIGDAARFVDPIFSSGVSIAMQSSKFAAEAIIQAFQKNQFDKSQFLSYQEKINRGCQNWHDFITLYYRLNVVFTYFLGKKEYRKDVLKFLQGDVYDESDPEFLKVMRKFVEDVETNPKHPLHDYLGELTAHKFSVNH
ncbi:MAG: tryptophan 7-halogenase [Flavobacteriales bacterium]|nr:tryptophan 7-halogenase [Flavobacteriales bacterium]